VTIGDSVHWQEVCCQSDIVDFPNMDRASFTGRSRRQPPFEDVVDRYDVCRTAAQGVSTMSVVRLLGFATLPCGCVVGKYRDVASTREVVYVEEKGLSCESPAHRRNHTVTAERERFASTVVAASLRAS
jgi:hypothetical protein